MSPVDKDGNDVTPDAGGLSMAAASGDSFLYSSVSGGFAGASGAGNPLDQYLAVRNAQGWNTVAVTPPSLAQASPLRGTGTVSAGSPDLSGVVVQSTEPLTGGVSGATSNLFLRTSDGAYTLLTTPQPPVSAGILFDEFLYQPYFAGASANFSKILLMANSPLTSSVPASSTAYQTYEWSNGTLQLVGILPDGSLPENGALPGSGASPGSLSNAVSADGSRAVFTSLDDHQVYVRDIPAGTTVEASASQGGADATGAQPSRYWTASTDESLIFFTSSAELTPNANTGDRNSTDSTFCPDCGNDLYEYDVDTGTLTDLSVDSNPADVRTGANVQGVVGTSADGSYVYFVASGQLIPGQGTPGGNNVYLYHAGRVTLVAGDADGALYEPAASAETQARVTPDGLHLVFMSTQSLTGYDNTDAATDQPDSEVYEYDAASGTLTCVSCNPSGAPPIGPSSIPVATYAQGTSSTPAGAWIYEPHDVTDDGTQVFFDSSDALVPQAPKGVQSVYEWEAEGTGSCDSTAQNGGCLYLISSTAGSDNSSFLDATANGSDVFFTTRDQLVPQDTDANVDVYDARVDGGLAAQNQSPAPGCSGDQCQGPVSAAPAPPAAASVSFVGPGNPPGNRTLKIRILSRVVRGSTFYVRVAVPAKGTLEITGSGIRARRRSVAKAGSYRVRISLSAKEKRKLAHNRKVKVNLRIGYTPTSGGHSVVTVRMTVEQAHKRRRKG